MVATLDLGNLLVHLRMNATQYMAMMDKVEARMRMTSQRLTTIGRSMTMRVTAPLIAMGGASVKAFASFDDAMTKSLAIMSDITPQLRKEMEKLALEISSKGVVSAKELARSYFYLASAGFDASQSMAALKTVTSFATAGAFDMALATDLLTDAQSALGLTVKNAQQNMKNMKRVSDTLIGANTLANATTQQFSEALTSQAGPAMKAYGIELEEGVAVLAAYADQGIKAQHAGNMMSRMLRLMTKGFMDNREEWERFNINIFDASGGLKPLYTIIGDLSEVLNKMSTRQKIATLQMLGFQARSQQAILPLLGLQDRIEEYNEELLEMQGITDEITRKQLKSFSSQMKILWNQIKDVATNIGKILAPSILSLNEKIKDLIKGWEALDESTKLWIVRLSVVVASIGPVLFIGGKLLALIIKMKVAVYALNVSLIRLKAILIAVNAAMSAHPYIIIGAGIAAVGYKTYQLVGALKDLYKAKKDLAKYEDPVWLYEEATRIKEALIIARLRRREKEKAMAAEKAAALVAQERAKEEQEELARAMEAEERAAILREERLNRAKQIFEATRTPLERYEIEIGKLNELLGVGALKYDTYRRAVLQAKEALEKSSKVTEDSTKGLKRFALQIFEATRTPMERFRTQIEKLREAFEAGFFEKLGGAETVGRAIEQIWEKLLGKGEKETPLGILGIPRGTTREITPLISPRGLALGGEGSSRRLENLIRQQLTEQEEQTSLLSKIERKEGLM